MKKIILFGGAFDPPHLGHQNVTKQLLEHKIADEVWYVPTSVHDFEKEMSAAKHRVAMLELILQKNTRIEKCEFEREGISHTFDTLNELSIKYPDYEFSWVIGADNLPDFHKWWNYEIMLKKYQFYVYPRKNQAMEPLHDGMTPLTDFEKVVVSSTEIRKKVKKGENITGLVDSKVEKYIINHDLYES